MMPDQDGGKLAFVNRWRQGTRELKEEMEVDLSRLLTAERKRVLEMAAKEGCWSCADGPPDADGVHTDPTGNEPPYKCRGHAIRQLLSRLEGEGKNV